MSKRVFDGELFFLENGIPFHTSGFRQCRPGWLQINCPFCKGHPHMGFNKIKGYFNCYSCGWHSVSDTLKVLGFSNISKIFNRYGNRRVSTNEVRNIRKAKVCLLPLCSYEPKKAHRTYLKEQRGLNWKAVQGEWDIQFTDQMTETGYAWRVIIPIYHEGRLVSFQARAISDEATLRYRTCPADREVMNVKETLYGIDQAIGDTVVVVEGVFDVWKLGPGAVATFGIDYSIKQVQLLVNYTNIRIMFDWADQQARDQADKLATELTLMGCDAEVVELEGVKDPGELSTKEGRKVMRELMS